MNTDFRIAVGMTSHPKTIKLMRRCGDRAFFCLVHLWEWAAQFKPEGDLTGMDDEAIEIASGWTGEDGVFVTQLSSVGFLDGEPGSYSLHDWREHNDWASEAEVRSGESRLSKLAQVNRDAFDFLQERGVTSISKEEYLKSKNGDFRWMLATAERPQSDPAATAERPLALTTGPAPAPSPFPSLKEKDVGGELSNPTPDAGASDAKPKSEKRSGSRFVPPTAQQVAEYCQQRSNTVDPQRFVDYYTANGWRVGKNPMRDWQAAVRTWERDVNGFGNNGGAGNTESTAPENQDELVRKIRADREERERKKREQEAVDAAAAR